MAKYSEEYRAIADSELFDVKWKYNSDIKKAKADPILHYLMFGWKECRMCTPYFDNNQYLYNNPDVDMNPLAHWLMYGRKEKRKAIIKKYGIREKFHEALLYPLKIYQEYQILSAEMKVIKGK